MSISRPILDATMRDLHFASSLVQIGVPLNTVRDLLSHASVAMSLRYAHLAPDQRREAVMKLSSKRSAVLRKNPIFADWRSFENAFGLHCGMIKSCYRSPGF